MLAGSPVPSQPAAKLSGGELSSKVATLWSYENQFGPYHPLTLRLMTEVGVAYGCGGELAIARALLERAVRDLTRYLGADHPETTAARTELAWILLHQANGGVS